MLNPDLLFGGGCANGHGRDIGRVQYLGYGIKVFRAAFKHQAEFLGKQDRKEITRTPDVHIKTAVAGKGHLQQGGDQAAVADVMAGQNQVFGNQFLNGCKGAADQIRIVHVRALVS